MIPQFILSSYPLILPPCAAFLFNFLHTFRPVLVDHESDCANNLNGVTRIATRSFTVQHTCSQRPHPTQRSVVTTRRCRSESVDKASVGHLDAQAWQHDHAVQVRCDTAARPIRGCPRC